MYNYSRSPYLAHYGRLGMKWGQHIFTDEKNISSAASAASSASKAFKEAAQLSGNYSRRSKPSKRFKKVVSDMSDDELRRVVNRLNLERQYATLTGADTRRGADVSREILQTAGSLVGIASGALTTAMLLKRLKG